VVALALARQRDAVANMPGALSPAHFLQGCAQAIFSLRPVAAAQWPKLVISGDWSTAPAQYRAYSGKAMMACGRVIAAKIGARLLRVAGAVALASCAAAPGREPGAQRTLGHARG
jgi:hypothetical protein